MDYEIVSNRIIRSNGRMQATFRTGKIEFVLAPAPALLPIPTPPASVAASAPPKRGFLSNFWADPANFRAHLPYERG